MIVKIFIFIDLGKSMIDHWTRYYNKYNVHESNKYLDWTKHAIPTKEIFSIHVQIVFFSLYISEILS